MQYLNLCYPDTAAREQFGDWLTMQLVSEKPRDLMLEPSVAARGVSLGSAYLVHPAALSMLPISSSKPAPYPRVSKLLADEILKNGFLSEHDHLIVHNPVDDTDSPSKYGWLHYIKGSARSATLLVIIELLLKIMGTGAVRRFHNAELWATYCQIYVRWDVWRPDKRTISFRNAKLSHAGSIREPNDLITWVMKLKALHDSGTPSSLIAAWNEMATPESALKGAKYTGVLNLLSAPSPALEVILKHNGKVGRDKTFFTDSTWTCKKLYPGGVWKGPTKFWNMKTTEESFLAMVSKLALAQEAKPPGMRSSVQLQAIQDVAHQCAFLVKVIDDVAGRLPVPRQTLIDGFLRPFVEGRDFKTEMEVQAALQLKNADFRAEVCLSKVKELIEAQKMVVSSADSGLHDVTKVAAGALDAAQWNFLEKQLQLDVQTAIVYRRALSSVEIARHVAKRKWSLDRVQTASAIAEMFFAPGAESCQHIYFMDAEDGPSKVLVELDTVQQSVSSAYGLPSGQLMNLVWTNWIATSLTKAGSRAVHMSVIEAVVGQRDYQNLGVAVMPCHSYRGSRWTAEVEYLQALGNAGVNLDRVVPLLFDPHADRREERPNVFQLRVLTPLHCNKTSHFGPHGVYRDTPLARTNRVDGAIPLQSKDMLQVEDLGEDVVPATTNIETHIPQAEKWHQIGVDACHRTLVACTNDLKTLAGPNAMVVIVQGDTTCDMCRAWLKRRAPLGIPTHLILICGDASHLLWCRSFLHDAITDMYLAGELVVPGKPCPAKEPPAELLENRPTGPLCTPPLGRGERAPRMATA